MGDKRNRSSSPDAHRGKKDGKKQKHHKVRRRCRCSR